jgi:Zn finger protein HypA/HybF involved in hydrogenase expression
MPTKDQERLMHEMKAVQMVFDELMHMEPKPSKVKIRLGRMKADPRVFRQMFKEFAVSLGFSDVEIKVEEIPVVAECKQCGFSGRLDVMEHVHFVRCPDCKKVADIVQGDELEILGP